MKTLLLLVMFATSPEDCDAALACAPLPPCETENMDNCYWDASVRGGWSYVILSGAKIYADLPD